jgi:hypothetical protein
MIRILTLIRTDNHDCALLGTNTEVLIAVAVALVIAFVIVVDFVKFYDR